MNGFSSHPKLRRCSWDLPFQSEQNFNLFHRQSCENLLVYLSSGARNQLRVKLELAVEAPIYFFHHWIRWNAWENCGTQTDQSGKKNAGDFLESSTIPVFWLPVQKDPSKLVTHWVSTQSKWTTSRQVTSKLLMSSQFPELLALYMTSEWVRCTPGNLRVSMLPCWNRYKFYEFLGINRFCRFQDLATSYTKEHKGVSLRMAYQE